MEKLNAAFERLDEFKREHGRYTLEEAALFISEQTGEPCEGMKSQLIAAVKDGDLQTYSPESFTKNYSKITRDFYEHVYWNELNDWLKKNKPHVDCKFPKPDAPAAKVATLPDTSPSGDEIPGKMPQTNIGKLAIKAAWQIECDTNKRATAKQVIEKLQAWTETEPELAETIPHGVKWTTTKGKQKPFDIEACAKALETWQASRA